MKYASTYLVSLIVFLLIDALWLGAIARGIYVKEMGTLMRRDPNFVAAALFYLVYAGGLVFFAVAPGLKDGSALSAFLLGAALGLVAYGTYDLTNLSVTNGFTLKLAIIDLAWGTFLTAVSAAISTAILLRFAPN
jgi:uncharacterized membrane protein